MTSPLLSWNSRREIRTISPEFTHTRFLIFPRMWQRRRTPSKQCASRRPLPSMRSTWPYSDARKNHQRKTAKTYLYCILFRDKYMYKYPHKLADRQQERKPKGAQHTTCRKDRRAWCTYTRNKNHLPWPSSLNCSSRFSPSLSFFPLLRFLPPFPENNISNNNPGP